MLDRQALAAIHLMEEWEWQRPHEIYENDFLEALQQCAAVLVDGDQKIDQPNAKDLIVLIEQSNRKLFAFVPKFQREYAFAEPQQREKLLEISLAQCCNRFERRIVSGSVDTGVAS